MTYNAIMQYGLLVFTTLQVVTVFRGFFTTTYDDNQQRIAGTSRWKAIREWTPRHAHDQMVVASFLIGVGTLLFIFVLAGWATMVHHFRTKAASIHLTAAGRAYVSPSRRRTHALTTPRSFEIAGGALLLAWYLTMWIGQVMTYQVRRRLR